MTKKQIIQEKIYLLRGFRILKKNDSREPAVRKLLARYPDEESMQRVLHDVIFGNTTLDALLTAKGVM